MPIDFRLDDEAGRSHRIIRHWEIDGHEVALILRGLLDDPGKKTVQELVCECDYDVVPEKEDGNPTGVVVGRRDPEDCKAKKGVRADYLASCGKVLRKNLDAIGLAETILLIHRTVEAGRYYGQAASGMIYMQEVAALLGKQANEVYEAVKQLFAEGKLDLNGMILIDFVPRFRFPEEIRHMIRMLVESPLGWPNGDAGSGVIDTFERAINDSTDYKHGKDAFWEHNYPNIAPNHLLEFGISFIGAAIDRGERGAHARDNLRFTNCENVAKWLEVTAERFRAFGAANGFPRALTEELKEEEKPAIPKRRKKKSRAKKKP